MTRNSLILAAIAFVALAGAGTWYSAGSKPGSTAPNTALTTPLSAPVVKTAAEGDAPDTSTITEMTLGAADAPVTIVEYASFTCPHCADFHENQFAKLKTDYIDTGKVQFTFRDVYFDRIGLWASMLARCETPRFFGVSGLLFEKQEEWLSNQDPVQIAGALRKIGLVAGMNAETVDACMADADKAQALVAWFQAHQEADSVNSTPSLIINGEAHSNMSYPDLRKIIDAKLGQ